jgi:methanethiol S-methyltransferase
MNAVTGPKPVSMKLSRTFALFYGVFCYLLHWVTTIYLIGFLGNLWWPKTVDSAPSELHTVWALLVDLGAIVLFVFLHWLMARQWFKQRWSKWVPEPIERSTYVLTTCVILGFLFWVWQPIEGNVWLAQGEDAARFLTAIYLLGWALAIVSTFPINHWDLFGLRQVWLYWLKTPYSPPTPSGSILYRFLPHPIFVGYAISLWAARRMGWAHFLLSTVLMAFLLVDVRLAANEK